MISWITGKTVTALTDPKYYDNICFIG